MWPDSQLSLTEKHLSRIKEGGKRKTKVCGGKRKTKVCVKVTKDKHALWFSEYTRMATMRPLTFKFQEDCILLFFFSF